MKDLRLGLPVQASGHYPASKAVGCLKNQFYTSIFHQMHVGIAIWQLESLKARRHSASFREFFRRKILECAERDGLWETMAEVFPKFLDTQLPQIFQEVVLSSEAKTRRNPVR